MILAALQALKTFVESEHPRDADGKFTDDDEEINRWHDEHEAPDDDYTIGNINVDNAVAPEYLDEEEAENMILALGLPDGFKGDVTIDYSGGEDNFSVQAKGEGITMLRIFDPANKTVDNSYFRIDDDSPHKGRGTEIFTRQVEELERQGYEKMTTLAAGSGKENKRGGKGGYNGYYTWARLGYTPTDEGDILDIGKILTKYNKENSTDYKTLNEFVATTKGKEYWEKNGITWHGEFDLIRGSENRKNLKAYNDAKAKTISKFLITLLKTFQESEHPRDADGKFTDDERVDAREEAEADAAYFAELESGNVEDDVDDEPRKTWGIRNIYISSDEDLSKEDAEKYVRALGLPEDFDGKVNIRTGIHNDGFYTAIAEGEGITITRKYDPKAGEVVNEYFRIADDSPHKGSGSEIFTRQVEELEKQGYKKMIVSAAGDGKENKKGGKSGYNGYYTWARFGYSPTKFGHSVIITPILKDYNIANKTNYKTLNELVSTKSGQQYWRENGVPWHGEFDLTTSSENRKNLKAYNDAKAK